MVEREPDWVHLSENADGIAMNSYFAEHPEQIVGKMEMVSGPYGMESTCKPDESRPFEEQLKEAVERITGQIDALEAMSAQLEEAQTKLSNVEHQLETAKAEVNKPFAQEAELSEKLDRLTALNALLNMDEKGDDAIGMDEETQEAEPERKLADRPAERTSLKGKLSEMKARVSGTPAGRDAVDKAKGKEEVI